MIKVHRFNETWDVIDCDEGIAADLNDYFTYIMPNFQHMQWKKDPKTGKKVRTRGWDGKIRLFHKRSRKLPAGLRMRLVEFAAERELQLLFPKTDSPSYHEAMEDAAEILKLLKLPADKQPRDYQLKAYLKGAFNRRRIILSPTGSGKSLIIYMLLAYFTSMFGYAPNVKALVLVPTINLVDQMVSDFVDYGAEEQWFHKIYEGQSHATDRPVIVSTWQSIYDNPRTWFKQFNIVLCDEVHGATAKSIKRIMECCVNANVRVGLSGTLHDLPIHRLVLEGLFGPIEQVAETMELVKQGYLAKPIIKNFIFEYPENIRKVMKKADYHSEIDFLINCNPRNRFIVNLGLKCDGPTLILFRMIDHGKHLYQLLSLSSERKAYLIYGETPGEDREQIRHILDRDPGAIAVASYGTFSVGANIPGLKHIIFGSPYKSKIKVLQSIGRGTRITSSKDSFTVYDISDDLSMGDHQNHTLRHMIERVKYYAEEGFDYKFYNMEIE